MEIKYSETWLNQRRLELSTDVRAKLWGLIGKPPLTADAEVRIADAIEAQARADRFAGMNGEPWTTEYVDALYAWFADGHHSPAEKCLREVGEILQVYVKKVAAFEVELAPDLGLNTVDNFEKALHKLVEEIAEEGREERRRRWGSPQEGPARFRPSPHPG